MIYEFKTEHSAIWSIQRERKHLNINAVNNCF